MKHEPFAVSFCRVFLVLSSRHGGSWVRCMGTAVEALHPLWASRRPRARISGIGWGAEGKVPRLLDKPRNQVRYRRVQKDLRFENKMFTRLCCVVVDRSRVFYVAVGGSHFILPPFPRKRRNEPSPLRPFLNSCRVGA